MNRERILEWLTRTVKLGPPMSDDSARPLVWGDRPVYPTQKFDVNGDKCLVCVEDDTGHHVIRAMEKKNDNIPFHFKETFRWRRLNKQLSDLIVLALWEKL